MGSRYYNISAAEMNSFLSAQGFQPLTLPNTVELVYGKVVRLDDFRFSLRVYTGINPSGESRACGADAIRVQLYWMYEGQPTPVGKAVKCLRVKSWETNLQNAINKFDGPDNYKICPACGSPMVWRDKNGGFWGCATWIKTKCNGKPRQQAQNRPATVARPIETPPPPPPPPRPTIRPVNPVLKNIQPAPPPPPRPNPNQNPYRIPDHLISVHQKAVEGYYLDSTGNLVIEARAGAGKTAMLRHLASFRKSGETMLYLAFNRKNAKEGMKKFPQGVNCRTTHSWCNQILRTNFDLPEESNNRKNWLIMEDVYPALRNKDRKRIRKACFKLLGLAKNFAIVPGNLDGIRDVMDKYTFELESDGEVMTTVEVTNEILEKSLPNRCGLMYDFDDMLWWTVILNLDVPKIGVVLADEVQDFNACQVQLIKKMESDGSRIVAVGDPFQAVYRFRGADSDAFAKVRNMLMETTRGCEQKILPTNYRCAKRIIEYVRNHTIVSDIEADPKAIDGSVGMMGSYIDVLSMLVEERRG